MTVRKLLSELKKYPPNAEVGVQDHDACENEISSLITSVVPFDQSTSARPDYGQNVRVVIHCG